MRGMFRRHSVIVRGSMRQSVALRPPTRARFRATAVRRWCSGLVTCVLLMPFTGSVAAANSDHPGPTFGLIEVATADLEYSTVTGLVYASVPSGNGSLSDSLVTIDPKSGAVGTPIPIGSDPGIMDISRSGETVYVALNGSSTVRAFDVVTGTPGVEFSVGISLEPKADPVDPDVPLVPVELAVLPGDSSSVAVLSQPRSSTGGQILVIYTDGVARPNRVEFAGSLRLEFGENSTRLYAFAGSGSSPTFERFDVDANGVTIVDRTTNLIPGGRSPGDIEFHNGVIYATAGKVIDPEALTQVGSFFDIPFSVFRGNLLVEPGHPSNTAYYLRDNASQGVPMSLQKYNSDTFALEESASIAGASGIPTSLITTGEHRLAFRTSDDQVWLLSNLESLNPEGDQVGLVDPSQGIWYLNDFGVRNSVGVVTSFFYGNPGDLPIAGDWDGDGIATPGLFRQSDGFFYARNTNTQGPADAECFAGNPADIPIAGDWDGDGDDNLGIYRPSEQVFYLFTSTCTGSPMGAAQISFLFGNPGDKPVAGDWDGDGIDEIGLHRESTGLFYWRNTLDTGIADGTLFFGDPGDRFVAGDWGIVDGKDTPAVFRPSDTTFFFRHTLTQGNADRQFVFGQSGWLPVAGEFGLG